LKDKVLVLGSAGLIGHQVYNYLNDSDNYELHNISYRNKIQNDTKIDVNPLDSLNSRDMKDFLK